MPTENVVTMDLSRPRAVRLLKEIAVDSARVFITTHAEKRMKERKITRAQVERCLLNGNITEGPARGTQGNWEMRVEVYSAGEPVTVVAALDYDDDGNYIVVITVFSQ